MDGHKLGIQRSRYAREVRTDFRQVPVMRPQLPSLAEIRPYIEQIDEARYYSNHGTLLHQFEDKLATHFGVSARQIAVVSNGTVALSAALLALGAPPGSKCLLPSWTFVGSAAAVWAANLRPHFVDVDDSTWALRPTAIKRRTDLRDVGAVMVVSPFGSPIDIKAWDEFTSETGIPVLIDGAAAFDTVARKTEARPGKSPVMISLHATKVFGIGEGGTVLSTDDEMMERFRKICNFGVWGNSGGQILGYNGKLSEYHAAIGLAMLERWPERRAQVEELTKKYVTHLSQLSGISPVSEYGNGWVSCYCNVRVNGDGNSITDKLATMGVETRRWWKTGVHHQPAYKNFSRDDLAVTDRLGREVFGLPFFHDMTDEQFDYVFECLKAAM